MKKTLFTIVSLLLAGYMSAATVTFKDWDGTVLSTQDVSSGEAANEPAHPTREGYLFTGWDNGFAAVYSSATITAQYTALEALGTEVEYSCPFTSSTIAYATGPIEPWGEKQEGFEDVSYICTQSSVASEGNFHMLQMKWTESESTTYDPDLYLEYSFKAAAIINLSEISLLVGSSGWQWMRFTVAYSTDDYFDDYQILYETPEDIDKTVLTEISQNVDITVQEGDNFYLRVYPWMHNLLPVFADPVYTFYPIISELRISGAVEEPEPDPETPGEGIENAKAGVKAVKFFENGQLMIEKNGVIYNAQGTIVK